MNLPSHPDQHDDTPAAPKRNKRIIVAAIVLVALFAGLHLLRTVPGS